MSAVILLALTGLVVAPPVTPSAKDVKVQSVWIALGERGKVPSDAVLRAKKGADVRLFVVVEARVDKKLTRFAAVKAVRRRGRLLRGLQPWPAKYGALDIAVHKLEPNPPHHGIYDNTGDMEHDWHPKLRASHPKRWHWCAPEYVQTDTRWGNVWTHRADARPTTTPDYDGLGTMRFTARIRHRGKTVWTVSKGHVSKAGIKKGLAMLQVRLNDTPVGWMTELINVPYVYGSSSPTGRPRDHQSELAQGADCADMVVYGWRRAGRTLKYTWTGGLVARSRRRAAVTSLGGGRYRDAKGRAIAFRGNNGVQAGDLILWRRHVAVIAAVDPSGFLTPNTLILHTVVESPALVPLRKIGFGFDNPPFDLRRAKWEKSRTR